MGSLILKGQTSGEVSISPPAVAGASTLLLPAGNDTVVTLNAAQTLANKTLTAPTILNSSGRPMIAQTGGILQVVNNTYGTQVSTTSTSFVTTSFTTSITPSSASSKILVLFTANGYISPASTYLYFTVYRGGTNIGHSNFGFGELYGNSGDRFGQVSGSYLDSPATASSVSYTVYFKVSASTGYINLNTGEFSTMTLIEVSA